MNTNSSFQMPSRKAAPCRQSQSGVVLVIGLVFLLLLTILGVTAIQNSTMQERMAMNVSARNEAFQSAEEALIAGESAVISLDCTALSNQLDWPLTPAEPATWASYTKTDIDTDFESAYILASVPSQLGDDESISADESEQCGGYYYVFSKARSAKGMTVVLRSTVFKKF